MNEQNLLSARSRMDAALGRMLHRYPFYVQFISPGRWTARPSVGTMAVTVRHDSPRFYFSPAFVCSCSDAELEGVIHHEILHVVFEHPMYDPSLFPNERALLAAEEVTVNEYVPEPLPGDPLTLADFPELPPREDTVVRYHRLKDREDLAEKVRTIDMHGLWKDPSNQGSDADLEAIQQSLVSQLSRVGDRAALHWAISGLGRHDGGGILENIHDPASRPTPIPWQPILSRMIGHRANREATFLRPSRRMPERVGISPGVVYRPQHPPVLAAIDTSSSMQLRHFERIRAELDVLSRIAKVTVVQCDKQIRKTYSLRGPLRTIVGRGGTDLRPPLERQFLGQHHPSLVAYFTDGDGPVPDHRPPVPVLWCLTTDAKPPAPWGDVVKLTDRGAVISRRTA